MGRREHSAQGSTKKVVCWAGTSPSHHQYNSPVQPILQVLPCFADHDGSGGHGYVDRDQTKVVEHACRAPPYVNFEFQGGEPTINFDVIKHIVTYSRELNKTMGKELGHSLVTNMTYMKEDVADWLVDNNIWVHQPRWNRRSTQLQSHVDQVPERVSVGSEVDRTSTTCTSRLRSRPVPRGCVDDDHEEDIEHWKEIVHLYLDLGIRNVHLRPLNPYGFVFGTWKMIGCSIEEYLDFGAGAGLHH